MARRGRHFARPAARTMVWIGAGLPAVAVAASASALLATANAALLLLRPFTIVRSRLLISYSTDQRSADEHPFGAVGLIVVKESATAIGITALPTPITEVNADFFVYQGVDANFAFTTGTGYRNIHTHYVVDSKAMRKVDVDDDIAWILENRAAVGADVNIEGRILIKLH